MDNFFERSITGLHKKNYKASDKKIVTVHLFETRVYLIAAPVEYPVVVAVPLGGSNRDGEWPHLTTQNLYAYVYSKIVMI
jgi:hypothetical protein